MTNHCVTLKHEAYPLPPKRSPPTPMRLYQSNRLECLFARLVEICQSDPLPDPFAKEIIVVQHLGMRHWLSRQWAFKTGIAALLDFPLPARALGTLHRRLNPLAAQDKVWQREMLRWRILALLPEYAQNAEQGGIFAPLAAHLQKDADEAARFRLAGRIAEVFDQYQTYRPDLLAEWENSTTEKDRQALIRGLKEGVFDVISTDHAPHSREEKAGPMTKAPFGITGLETAVPLVITELVKKEILTPLQMAEKMSGNPAKILHLEDRGSLAEGKAADVVIIDPDEEYRIDPDSFFSRGRNTPFAGRPVSGCVKVTVCGGRIVYGENDRRVRKQQNKGDAI